MTVADNTSRNQYTATSGQTVFAYTFEIVDKDHVVVLKNGVALSEGTDYSVSNVGNDNGGNVTLTSGATAGDIMTLYRDMPYSRTQNYTNSGDFLASEVNSDFDELWLAGEQTDRAFSQSIRKPITDSDSISMELPEAATRANKFVKFDATGAVDVAGATVTVTAEDVTIDDAGNYYTSGNVEGALQEVGADLTANTAKLNTIETGADVTDTANVTAAGAVMDSELTNEAAVKALNQGVATTDSPTFAGATLGAVTYTSTDGTDGQVLMTNGAGVAAFEDMPSSTYLDVTDFGATGDGTTDDTTAIQNAINHASNNDIQTIFFPDGHYKYTTLRLYHDATDNPNFQETPNRDGRFVFLGTGRIAITDLRTYDGTSSTEGRLYGSVLESTSGGGGIIIDPTAAFDSKDARNFLGEKMTFIANNTTQIIEAKACPGLSFEFCSFKQLNNDGDGIIAQNAWFFTFTNCFLIGPDKDNATGTGIIGGTDFFAGQWNINQSLVDTWRDCVSWEKGEFVNVSFRDSAIQNANRYAIHGSGGVINQLLLDNTYFENVGVTGTSFVYGASNVIRNLVMQSNFILCGNNSGTSRITGPSVDLVNCDSFSLSGSYVFRMYTPVVRVGNTRNFTDISGRVENNFFRNDATIPRAYSGDNDRTEFGVPFTTASSVLTVTVDGVTKTLGVDYTVSGLGDIAGAVVTFTTAPSSGAAISIDATNLETYFLFEGKLPEFKNNIWTGFTSGLYDSSSIFKLFDDTSDYALNYQDGLYGVNSFTRLGLGDISVETGIASSPKGIAAGSDKTYYDLTHTIAGGLALTIPNNTGTSPNTKNNVPHGRMFIIKNNSASSDFIIVRNRSDFSTIQRLQRGMTGIFVLDAKGTGKFNLAGVFGGDDPIYDTVTALNSITVNEVTFDGTDGTSGQFLTTDGSGNLSFATATGTGITAVVDDMTPQLGGDLDLNGSDITGTGNLDFTGTINTVLSVDGTTEDVFITGAVPGLELVESDNGGSRVRYAVQNSGLFQSLYGADTSTFGSITQQTRLSDGTSNQVIYTYDAGTNDYHWWGTRAGGDRLVQIDSSGKFRVRGGDVSFFNDGVTSEAFFWDASTSRLGLGTTSPDQLVHLYASNPILNMEHFQNGSSRIYFESTTDGNWGAINASNASGDRKIAISPSSATGDTRFGGLELHSGATIGGIFDTDYGLNVYGNVGIGTNSPNSLLDVANGTTYSASGDFLAAIQQNTNVTGKNGLSVMNAWAAPTSKIFEAAMGWNGTASGYYPVFTIDGLGQVICQDENGSGRFKIDSVGNVGIGTNSPGTPLDVVSSNSNAIGLRLRGRSSDDLTIIQKTDNGATTQQGVIAIDSSGNIGLGTTVPTVALDVQDSGDATIRVLSTGTGASDDTILRSQISGTTASNYLYFGDADDNNSGQMRYVHSDDSMRFYAGATTERLRLYSSNTIFYNGTTELARFNSSNNFLVGHTSASGPGAGNTIEGLTLSNSGTIWASTDSNYAANFNRNGTDGKVVYFRNDGVVAGSVTLTGATTVNFDTSSDERLKENIANADDAGLVVDAIQVRKFDWIADGKHQRYGMVAQELNIVAPEAVTMPDDPEEMAGVDYSKLVPMLVKEIQSLRARVAQLEGAN